jgi:hypothetical protein
MSLVRLYHCSPISGLTELHPHQCKREDSSRFGLFLAPTIMSALTWRGRLLCERKHDPEHLYAVYLDTEQVKAWCDGKRGSRRRWDGKSVPIGDQVWIQQSIECRQIDWLKLLDEATNYQEVRHEQARTEHAARQSLR